MLGGLMAAKRALPTGRNDKGVRCRKKHTAAPEGSRILHADVSITLPVKLRAELPDPGIARAGYDPEQVAGEIAIRVIELGMIKDIEHFKANFKRRGLGNGSPLTEPKIRVV